MNIKAETVSCMTGLARDGRVLTAQFLFPETFSGFQGHFPTQKVLPGVCQILCAQTVIEQAEGVPVELTEIILAKYAAPVLPATELHCALERTAEDAGTAVYKARFDTGGKKVSELKLRVKIG